VKYLDNITKQSHCFGMSEHVCLIYIVVDIIGFIQLLYLIVMGRKVVYLCYKVFYVLDITQLKY
jgi:hypothetical protein